MSRSMLQTVFQQARHTPLKTALITPHQSVSYAQLAKWVTALGEQLEAIEPRCVALLAENSVAWVVADLAAELAGVPVLPVPTFFTPSQIQHVLDDAGVDTMLVDKAGRFESAFGSVPDHFCLQPGGGLELLGCARPVVHRPDMEGVAKVTYTSGSTGAPKGVCLSSLNMLRVCEALQARTWYSAADRHCCLLPLSTLLENVAGVYLPLISGASVYIWPDEDLGLEGTQLTDPHRMLKVLEETQATSAIMTPGLLQALIRAMESTGTRLPSLRVLAVGGAVVSPALVEHAIHLGLPLVQGYGLSECASVVSLNAPDQEQVATGKPLLHVAVDIAEDGEVLVRRNTFLGYLGQARRDPKAAWPTGDLGYLDDQGYLHITGRKSSRIITALGRNVSPEWVERMLCDQSPIQQAALFGDGQVFLSAVLHVHATRTDAEIQFAVDQANLRLPDYARVRRWIRAGEAFNAQNGRLNAKGELQRGQIAADFDAELDTIFDRQEHRYGVL